jgi:hypothetical protein
MCHRTPFNNYTYGSGYSSTAGEEAHAAAVVQCMDCHEHNQTKPGYFGHMNDPAYQAVGCVGPDHPCHKTLPANLGAGGFGLTGYTTDTGNKSAHRKFVLDAMDDPLMEGANEACLACHTRVGVNITWTKNENLEFNATEDGTGNWTIPSFAAGGENLTQVNTPNHWTNP